MGTHETSISPNATHATHASHANRYHDLARSFSFSLIALSRVRQSYRSMALFMSVLDRHTAGFQDHRCVDRSKIRDEVRAVLVDRSHRPDSRWFVFSQFTARASTGSVGDMPVCRRT
jgi:hypothetical protein